MKTINLCDQDNKTLNSKWSTLFVNQLTADINKNKDKLKSNYKKVLENWCDYPAFHCLFDEDKLVAFGAVQSENYPNACCRLLTRAYITTQYRKKNKNTLKRRHSYLTEGILKSQLVWAKNNEYKEAFVSMQFQRRQSFLKRWVKMLNDDEIYGIWQYQDRVFLTCPWPKQNSCWQWIATTGLGKDPQNLLIDGLKSITFEEYQGMFSR